jgi:hypothetical protein
VTTPADLVRDSCAQLAGYRATLERVVTEPSSPQGGMGPRPADAPFPGDAQAFAALMVIWEKVPRLEASLKLAVAGHPGLRRGGSAGNFLDALSAIPALAAGLDEDAEAAAARILEWLVDLARAVPAIDEAQRWRYVRGRACPYCGCWALKVLLDAAGRPSGHVECHAAPVVRDGIMVFCTDGNGLRPAAAMGTDEHGRPALMWADGRVETAPDMDTTDG